MRNEIQERICDECGKKEQMISERRYGGTPFFGWISARTEGVNGLTSPFDFCSSECAGKHFTLFREIKKETK